MRTADRILAMVDRVRHDQGSIGALSSGETLGAHLPPDSQVIDRALTPGDGASTPSVNRRMLMHAVAAFAVSPAVASPAIAPKQSAGSNSDAELVTFGAEFDRLVTDYLAAEKRANPLLDECLVRMPRKPEALLIMVEDLLFTIGVLPGCRGSGRHYDKGDVELIRKYRDAGIACHRGGKRTGNFPIIPRDEDDLREQLRRIDEIVTAHDRWQSERDRVYESTGLAAAERSLDEIQDRLDDVIGRILAVPAVSVAGLRVKARIVAWCRNLEDAEDSTDAEHYTDTGAMLSIVRDLLEIEPA